jgi:hypothetical protein
MEIRLETGAGRGAETDDDVCDEDDGEDDALKAQEQELEERMEELAQQQQQQQDGTTHEQLEQQKHRVQGQDEAQEVQEQEPEVRVQEQMAHPHHQQPDASPQEQLDQQKQREQEPGMQEARGVLIQGSRRSKRLKTRRSLSRLTKHEAQAAEEVAAEDVLEAQAADEFAEDQVKFTTTKRADGRRCALTGEITACNMGPPATSLRLGPMMGASISSAHMTWNPSTRERLKTLKGHSHSKDNKDNKESLLSLRILRRWHLETANPACPVQGYSERNYGVRFLPDVTMIASCSGQGYDRDNGVRLSLWDVWQGRELKKFQGHSHWVTSCALAAA